MKTQAKEVLEAGETCCHYDKEYNLNSTLIVVEDGIRREYTCRVCGELIEWWEID